MSSRLVRIIVPKIATPDYKKICGLFERSLLRWFGGFSVTEIRGGWKNDEGEIIYDNSWRYESLTDDTILEKKQASLRIAARYLAERLDQECILVDVLPVNKVWFVEPSKEEATL